MSTRYVPSSPVMAKASAAGRDVAGEVNALVSYLSLQGYRVSMSDELRLARIATFLDWSGNSLDANAALIGPVICRSPRDQQRLKGLLAIFSHGVEDSIAPATKFEEAVRKRRRRRSWAFRLLAAGAAVALAATAAEIAKLLAENGAHGDSSFVTVSTRVIRATVQRPLWMGLLVLIPGLIGVVFVLRRRRPDPMIVGRRPRDPVEVALATSPAQSRLLPKYSLDSAIRLLRRPRRVLTPDLDIARSVDATVACAGFPELVPAQRTILPEYILLTDRVHARDHVGGLADVLAARLGAAHLRTCIAEFDGDPTHLRIRSGKSWRTGTLDRLAEESAMAPLILFTNASSLWDMNRGCWRRWVDELDRFGACAILTPMPLHGWSRIEHMLEDRGFAIAPATAAGVLELAERFAGKMKPLRPVSSNDGLAELLATDPLGWHDDEVPPPFEREALIAALRARLSESEFLLLCTLAVYPASHPRLSEEVGRALAVVQGIAAAAVDGQPIERDYAALAGLPWMRMGRFPEWLRQDLLEAMPAEGADAARTVWTNVLQPVEADEAAPSSDAVIRSPQDNSATRRALLRLLNADVMSDPILTGFLRGTESHPVGRRGRLGREPFDQVDLATVAAGVVATLLLFATLPSDGGASQAHNTIVDAENDTLNDVTFTNVLENAVIAGPGTENVTTGAISAQELPASLADDGCATCNDSIDESSIEQNAVSGLPIGDDSGPSGASQRGNVTGPRPKPIPDERCTVTCGHVDDTEQDVPSASDGNVTN